MLKALGNWEGTISASKCFPFTCPGWGSYDLFVNCHFFHWYKKSWLHQLFSFSNVYLYLKISWYFHDMQQRCAVCVRLVLLNKYTKTLLQGTLGWFWLHSVDCFTALTYMHVLVLMLHSPESNGEADADPAATVESGPEGTDLYQTEDGKLSALCLLTVWRDAGCSQG